MKVVYYYKRVIRPDVFLIDDPLYCVDNTGDAEFRTFSTQGILAVLYVMSHSTQLNEKQRVYLIKLQRKIQYGS